MLQEHSISNIRAAVNDVIRELVILVGAKTERSVLRQLEIPRNVTKNSPLPSGKDTPGEEGTPCGRGRGPSPYHRV